MSSLPSRSLQSKTPKVSSGEQVFAVAHIYASFNDTHIHVTDLTGRETIAKYTGGMKVKADRDESSPYAAMLATQDAAEKAKSRGITAVHIKLRAMGGTRTKTPGPGAQAAIRAFARSGLKLGRLGTFLHALPSFPHVRRSPHWVSRSRDCFTAFLMRYSCSPSYSL